MKEVWTRRSVDDRGQTILTVMYGDDALWFGELLSVDLEGHFVEHAVAEERRKLQEYSESLQRAYLRWVQDSVTS